MACLVSVHQRTQRTRAPQSTAPCIEAAPSSSAKRTSAAVEANARRQVCENFVRPALSPLRMRTASITELVVSLSALSLFACSAARPNASSSGVFAAESLMDVAERGSPSDAAAEDSALPREPRWLSEDFDTVADASVVASVARCAAGDGNVVIDVERETLEAQCDDGITQCSVVLSIRARNCTANAIAIRSAQATSSNGAQTQWAFRLAAIEPGEAGTREVRIARDFEEELPLEVAVLDASRSREWRWRGVFRVVIPARRRAMAECEACHGVWRRWGMLQREACNCRTGDAGRACEDGRDCEGLCLPTGSRIVSPEVRSTCVCPAGCRCSGRPRRRPNGTLEALCAATCTAARPAMVVDVGVCSEFRMNFGCRSRIPDGARDRGPRPAGLSHHAYVCAD